MCEIIKMMGFMDKAESILKFIIALAFIAVFSMAGLLILVYAVISNVTGPFVFGNFLAQCLAGLVFLGLGILFFRGAGLDEPVIALFRALGRRWGK